MATKMFCDIGGEEISATDSYFSLALTEHNNRGHRDTQMMSGDRLHDTVAREIENICVRCARTVAKASVAVDDKDSP